MKIAVLDWYTVNISGDIPVSQLEKMGDVRVFPLTSPDETVANIGDAEVVLCNKVLITREVMDAYLNKHGQRIVFIHGKGEGKLRQHLLSELKRRYPRCTAQDASFREYGFGATQVTIH